MPQFQVPYDTTQDVTLSQITQQAVGWLARNAKWLLGGLILGAIAGFIWQAVLPDKYQGRFVGFANNLNDIRIREIMGDLDGLRRGGQTKALATALNLTEQEAATLSGFDAEIHNVLEVDVPFPPREVSVYYFAILVRGTNPEIFNKVESGIVSYISKLPYVEKRLSIRKAQLKNIVDQIDNEIAYLEDVKKKQAEALASGKGMFADMGAPSVNMVDLMQRKTSTLIELESMNQEIVVTKPLTTDPKPVTAGPIRGTLTGAAYGLALAIAMLAIVGVVQMGRRETGGR